MNIKEKVDEFVSTIGKNTRTVILAKVDHNGEAEATMTGDDKDVSWLKDLIDAKFKNTLLIKCQIEQKGKSNVSPNDKN